MNSRNSLIVQLCKECTLDTAAVHRHLDILESVRGFRKAIVDENVANSTKIDNLENAIRTQQSLCDHPITWLDSGGQYQSQQRWCKICGAEVKK